MKVYIGPYVSWLGPYQLTDKLFFWTEKYPEDKTLEERWDYKAKDKFGDWLADTWVTKFLNWVYSKRNRKEKVRIDYYDVWSMDHTLALIILPMLKKLKTQKHGYGMIDDKDVPREYRSTVKGAKQGLNQWDWDHNAEARYAWMLEELIWTFTQLCDDQDGEGQFFDHTESSKEKDFNRSIQKLKVDRAGLELHQKRIDNGLRLFGKYFRTLWD
jgi:hypothetical protein